jgi:hypothetical protein
MADEEPRRSSGWLLILAVTAIVGLLYLVACMSPAVELAKAPPDPNRAHDFGEIDLTPDIAGEHLGIGALLLGWVPPWTLAWLANPLLLAAWVLLMTRNPRLSLCTGVLAALAGLTTWNLFTLFDGYRVQSLLVGYYLWQASLTAIALGAVVVWVTGRASDVPGAQSTEISAN